MERTRRRLLYTAAVVAVAPFAPRLVQGQPGTPAPPARDLTSDRVMEEILHLQTRGLATTKGGLPTPEGIRAQAAAARLFAAHSSAVGLEEEVRRQAGNERARRRAGRAPRRLEESELRAILRQRGVDGSQLVLPAVDPAREDQALAMLSDAGLAETLRATATAMEQMATLIEERGGFVVVFQEHQPYQQSPEEIACSNMATAQQAASVAAVLACVFPMNPACGFFAGLYAGLTLTMLYYGCF